MKLQSTTDEKEFNVFHLHSTTTMKDGINKEIKHDK
jgi:hypothetical protein